MSTELLKQQSDLRKQIDDLKRQINEAQFEERRQLVIEIMKRVEGHPKLIPMIGNALRDDLYDLIAQLQLNHVVPGAVPEKTIKQATAVFNEKWVPYFKWDGNDLLKIHVAKIPEAEKLDPAERLKRKMYRANTGDYDKSLFV